MPVDVGGEPEFVVVWRFRVGASSVEAFERAYGTHGPWVELFAGYRGFLGSELVRSDEPGQYLTIDRWASRAAFDACMDAARDDYARLDGELAVLTGSEELVARGASLADVAGP